MCPRCGGRLHRRARKGFLQNGVLPHFGYYPWECFSCSKTRMLRARGRRTAVHSFLGKSLVTASALAHASRLESTPSPKSGSSASSTAKALPDRKSAPLAKAEVPAPAQSESLPPAEAEAEVPAPAESATLRIVKAEAPLSREKVSSQILSTDSSDQLKSGPLFSRRAEALRAPKREFLGFRRHDPSQSLNTLPPVSEAAVLRAIFEEDSSPETAHSPVAPPVGA